MEKFYICMSVYHKDDPQWFALAVQSVLDQTVKPDEVILVVDGPIPPALDEAVRRFEPDICVIRLPENKGLGNARAVGVAACRNELIAMMDTDDISLPDRFEKQLQRFAEEPQLDALGGYISEFTGTPENIIGLREVPASSDELAQYIKTRCPLNHMTVILKKSRIDEVGGYQDWIYNEDYYLWIRMHLAGMRFGNVPQVLVNVRVGADLYKRRGGRTYFMSEYRIQKYMRKHGMISIPTFVLNVAKRVVVQLLLPNSLRGFVYRRFARTQKK